MDEYELITEEERIMASQLNEAAKELLRPVANDEDLNNRLLAQEYFFLDDLSDNPHSFLNICRWFGIEPLKIRKALIKYQLGEKPKSDLDKFIIDLLASEREVEREIEVKTLAHRVDEETKELRLLLRRRMYGELKKIKKRERKKRIAEGRRTKGKNKVHEDKE